jgi:hypothetical protein
MENEKIKKYTILHFLKNEKIINALTIHTRFKFC